MKVLTIYLSEGETLTKWAVKEANTLLNPRYKIVHLAIDMKVPYHTVRRFISGENVALDVLDKFIQLYLQKHVYANKWNG